MRPPPPPAIPTVSLPSVPRRWASAPDQPGSPITWFSGGPNRKRTATDRSLSRTSPPLAPSLLPSSCRIGIDAIRPRPRVRCGGLQLGGGGSAPPPEPLRASLISWFLLPLNHAGTFSLLSAFRQRGPGSTAGNVAVLVGVGDANGRCFLCGFQGAIFGVARHYCLMADGSAASPRRHCGNRQLR